jgi:predicted permease
MSSSFFHNGGSSLRKCANDIQGLFVPAVGYPCCILLKVVTAGGSEQAMSFSSLPVGVTAAIVVCFCFSCG